MSWLLLSLAGASWLLTAPAPRLWAAVRIRTGSGTAAGAAWPCLRYPGAGDTGGQPSAARSLPVRQVEKMGPELWGWERCARAAMRGILQKFPILLGTGS